MSELRKSGSPKSDVTGNKKKYHSHREAWARINQAIDEGFYFEAVTIEESIITDRLISHLVGVGAIEREEEPDDYGTFRDLLVAWRNAGSHPIQKGGFEDLQDATFNWKNQRNTVIHQIAKSSPGDPTEPIDDFLETAKDTAEKGKELARAIDHWHSRMKANA
jgi:hypothetical protein